MTSDRIRNAGNVADYVRNVSVISGLNISEERLKSHIHEFLRLLNDVEVLNDLVTGRDFLQVGPITAYTHTKSSLDSKQS